MERKPSGHSPLRSVNLQINLYINRSIVKIKSNSVFLFKKKCVVICLFFTLHVVTPAERIKNLNRRLRDQNINVREGCCL